ncbi:DMT family transporter [Glycomyces albidus]|uniref:QacE family quaternary ammonium compound efflux SMR transporter n=1 Tax=Glycomyces albidus TaxID=2656774 RepID=A0A6L5GGG3_9ACTN|nr:SMR family transporter [Glycomyces albidus]MQM28645.1 QacE family quaternary ammonium compound efflux SMR transporter [Glycomyces albidus]
MKAKPWLLLSGAIVSEVTASLSLKAAIETPPLYIVVVVGFLATFVFLSAVLKAGMPLGVAYGVWGAMGVVLTAVFGAVLYGEPLTGVMGAGIALIIAGVVTIEMGAERAARETEGAA